MLTSAANPVSFATSIARDAPPPGPLTALALAAAPRTVDAALEIALALCADATAVVPGAGGTRDLWEALATLAASDLGVARAVEPHLDATAILRSAGDPPLHFDSARATWGVFAAEGGEPLLAAQRDGLWVLDGTKPWCSLASTLDAALITATTGDGERALFAVDLGHQRVEVVDGAWVARGLTEIPSGPVRFAAVPATPVGAPGWYLERPGFALGGIGVAACWFGGAVGIGRTVFAAARTGTDPFRSLQLGAIDARLEDSRRALAEAAAAADSGELDAAAASLLVKRVRATVADACEEIIGRAGHALGPAPLALDAAHAKRVADLQLYVRQHHGERDLASLGNTLLNSEDSPW